MILERMHKYFIVIGLDRVDLFNCYRFFDGCF